MGRGRSGSSERGDTAARQTGARETPARQTPARQTRARQTDAIEGVPSNLVVLAGHLSSEPVVRTLPSGSVLCTLEVTTPSASGSAASVPVAWFDPADTAAFTAGDEVVVVGEVRRRFFRGAAGTQSRTEVVAGHVLRPSQRARVRTAVGRAIDGMRRDGSAALRSP